METLIVGILLLILQLRFWTSQSSLTWRQRRLLRKIRASPGEVRFNLRRQLPLTALEAHGLITVRIEAQLCAQRGRRFYFLARATVPEATVVPRRYRSHAEVSLLREKVLHHDFLNDH